MVETTLSTYEQPALRGVAIPTNLVWASGFSYAAPGQSVKSVATQSLCFLESNPTAGTPFFLKSGFRATSMKRK